MPQALKVATLIQLLSWVIPHCLLQTEEQFECPLKYLLSSLLLCSLDLRTLHLIQMKIQMKFLNARKSP